LNAVVTGTGSLFQTHFPFEKGAKLDSPQSIHRLTDLEKREMEFKIRMLAKGVHVMHGGGCLTTAHSDEDIGRIIKAARDAAREMIRP
jgi:glutamate-1-semialdehyde 2,1-aminomutase